MWCKVCIRETNEDICNRCGNSTDNEVPIEVCWCSECKVPIIKTVVDFDKDVCPICEKTTSYLCADLRPVFPEERLLFEILQGKPLEYIDKSVWASDNRYYVDGKAVTISKKSYNKYPLDYIVEQLNKYRNSNNYDTFNVNIEKFITANNTRLNYLIDEAHTFINQTAKNYPQECVVVSFSGGKDSTVISDLAIKALGNPSLVHIFGNTTLEFPLTIEYAERFKTSNPKTIFKIAENTEQDFYKICEDIGPPARMLRWCCSMFKTGPITRVINDLYPADKILTFRGIRKSESVSRSKYNRFEDSPEYAKIQKQDSASPIFFWKDIEVWLYILGEQIDFNAAYRLGYDRVGCWCCPNNNIRAQFLTSIYMPERYNKWRDFLIDFAKNLGKPDPEEYVDVGGWKARQGGKGLASSKDVIIKFTNCTTEENAKVYQLNKEINDSFIELFIPFGRIAPELGRKIINETIIIDRKTNVPILSIQPFVKNGYEHSVKIKTMNVAQHDEVQRMVGYQIKKYNACRKCLKCESLCRYGAIYISDGNYHINGEKCKRCKMCVTAKYLEGGCLMQRYLRTRGENK